MSPAAQVFDDPLEVPLLAGSESIADSVAASADPHSGPMSLWRSVARRRLCAASALCAADAVTFLASWAALVPFGAADGAVPRIMALTAVVTLALFWSKQLYPGYRLHGYELLRRRGTVTLWVAAVSAAATLLLSGGWRQPLLVTLFLGVALAAQPFLRSLVRGLLLRWGIWGERAVSLGDPRLVAEISEYFTRHWQYGIRPQTEGALGPVPSVALIAGGNLSRREVARLRLDYADVMMLADFPGLPISGLRPSEIGGEIGLRFGGEASATMPVELLHRAFDFVVAAAGLVLVLPLLLAAGVAIYVADPGPVLYRQTREGLRGRPFPVLKLRTMYRDADRRFEALMAADPEARAEWNTHFKLRDDPRILPGIGGLLRATSIDELPQLLNVLAGDMRLVGPRPFPVYHLAAMDAIFRVRRRSVTPGLTGLWQISERSEADLDRQRQLDEFYIENRSFWFDLHVLLKTVPAVVRGDGAY